MAFCVLPFALYLSAHLICALARADASLPATGIFEAFFFFSFERVDFF
jgi:hypothetical protein